MSYPQADGGKCPDFGFVHISGWVVPDCTQVACVQCSQSKNGTLYYSTQGYTHCTQPLLRLLIQLSINKCGFD